MLLSIDPGVEIGLAVFDACELVYVSECRLPRKGGRDSLTLRRAGAIRGILDDARSRWRIDAIAIETTDWHQNLYYSRNWRVAYARERKAQQSLNFALGVVALYCVEHSIPLIEVPVTDWHRWIGSRSKDAVAELVWLAFRKKIEKRDNEFYFQERKISSHEIDAIGVGYYAVCSSAIQT